MSTDAEVPEWALTEIRYWIDMFNLEAWNIQTRLERVVNDNPDCLGWCDRTEHYNRARLHFRDDMEDTPAWRRIILHECIHIVMGRVDGYVEEAVIPNLAEAAQDLARTAYVHHVESFVEMLTGAYWRYYTAQQDREHPPEASDADDA